MYLYLQKRINKNIFVFAFKHQSHICHTLARLAKTCLGRSVPYLLVIIKTEPDKTNSCWHLRINSRRNIIWYCKNHSVCQCFAVYASVSQCMKVYHGVLQCITVYDNVWQWKRTGNGSRLFPSSEQRAHPHLLWLWPATPCSTPN